MSTVKLHFSGSDPSNRDRIELNEAHQAYWDARRGDSNDDEHVAASEFIEALMNYAGISGIDVEECVNCNEEATAFYPNLTPPLQFCDSCDHDARRSGWEPGA